MTNSTGSAPRQTIPLLPFRITPACSLAYIVILLAGGRSIAEVLRCVGLLVALLLVAVAHQRPTWRRLKYDMGLLGIWGIGVEASTVPDVLFVHATFFWLPCLAFGVSKWLQNPTLQSTRAQKTYRLTHFALGSFLGALILGSLLMLVVSQRAPGLFAVGVAAVGAIASGRYLSGELLSQQAFLYLRSFSSLEVLTTFRRAVVPALSDRVILLGLSRTTQKKKLNPSTFGLSSAWLYSVPDEEWRTWVSRQLLSAAGVIVDLTAPTANVAWELEQAVTALPAARIVALVPAVDSPPLPYGIASVAYDGSTRSRKEVRQFLKQWVVTNVERTHERAAA